MSLSDPVCHPECIDHFKNQMEENFRKNGLEYFMRHHMGSCDKKILDKIEISTETEIIECIDLIKRQKKRCQNRKYKANTESIIRELDECITKFNKIIKEYGKK